MSIPLYIYTFLAMLHFAPIETLPQYPGHEETEREALARYGAIAEVIARACDKQGKPCASLLVAIGVGESRFAKDADVGPCYRVGKLKTRCDSSAAASVWQVQAHSFVTTAELFADRALAARATLKAARMCRHLAPRDQLFGLAGTCEPRPAHAAAARARRDTWQEVNSWNP